MINELDRLTRLRSPALQRHRMRRDDIVLPYRPGWAPVARVWSDRLTRGVLLLVAVISIVNLARCGADGQPVPAAPMGMTPVSPAGGVGDDRACQHPAPASRMRRRTRRTRQRDRLSQG